MPLLFQAFLLIITPFFFPVLLVWIIFLTVSSIIIIPFLCISISTYLFYLFLRRISVGYLAKVSIHFCAHVLDNTSPTTISNENQRSKGKEPDVDRAVSVEFDPLEYPSQEESEEDERVKEDESWQMQIFNAFGPGDDKPFYQTLNFWRKKEGEKT